MRLRTLAIAALLLALPMPGHATSQDIRIAELLPDPDTGQREFIEIWNDGPDAVNLTGWWINDTADNQFVFPVWELAAGARVVVWGGGAADARGPAWSRATAWNNGGDQALLYDNYGVLVDVLAYGSSAWPDGRNATVPDVPATGRSLTWQDGWIDARPTPGTVAAPIGGSVQASVENVAPSVTIDLPAEAGPGTTIDVTVTAEDPNGDADIVAWSLEAVGLATNGSAAGPHLISAVVPADRDSWTFTATATDHAGQTSNATATVSVVVGGLSIIMPAGGIAFPPFPPGASEVLANASFTIRNHADEAIAPRIDVSDLTGAGTIPVVGRLDIGNAGNWTLYDGPLTVLPEIPAGGDVQWSFRLRDLPTPLPAGGYGTSFTVVA